MLKATIIRLAYMVILFLASLVISNLALPGKFGILSLLILNASLLLLLTGLGVDSMVLYKLSNKQWQVSQAFRFVWKAIFLQTSVFILLELGCWLLFRRTLLSNATPDYFFVEACYFIGLAIIEKYVALYYSQNESTIVNGILASIAFFYLVILLLIYYFTIVDWLYILYLFAFQNIAQAIALVYYFKPADNTKANVQNKEFLAAFKVSSIVMVTNVIQLLAYRMDFWMIDLFYGKYDVGIYAQANKFANFSWIIPNILSQILIPSFASMDKRRSGEIFSTAFFLNFFIILFTVVFAQFFYFFYLDPQYKLGLNAFYVMLPGYFFWASVIYFANYFSSKGKFVYNLRGSVLCFVLILAADLLFIPRLGIVGAALANVFAYFTVFMFYLFILVKKDFFYWNDLLLPGKKSFFNLLKTVNK
jgi:O-antigen/teichoic acid export membrane protein